jgi:hypothetical protein
MPRWSFGRVRNKLINLVIQSNLSTIATLGTPKKWPLFKGYGIRHCYSQFKTIQFWRIGAQTGRCKKVAAVQRLPLTQV